MFCLKCGKELENGAKFCQFCGAPTDSAAGSPAGGAAPNAPQEPVPGMGPFVPPERAGADRSGESWVSATGGGSAGQGAGQGLKFLDPVLERAKQAPPALLIGGAAAAVAVIALIVVLASGLFSSPKGQVEKALAKTAAAYAQAGSKAGLPTELPGMSGTMKDYSGSQRLSLELSDINRGLNSYVDLSGLTGLGVRINSDWDQKGRKMDCDMAVLLDGDDFASIQLLVNGSNIYVASPEFTRGSVYGLNTETLGEDLDRLGADGGEVNLKKISFNLFDLVEKLSPTQEQTKEMKAAVTEANKALLDAVTAEKGGKKSVQVNGKSVEATLYKVVIPEDAMKDYISAMEDAMSLMDTEDMMKEALLSMGLDKSMVNQLMSGMDTKDAYKEVTRSLKQLVKTIGDVELDVYVDGGCVAAVEYDQRIEGERVELGLYLGGGDNYVDNLSLEIAVDDNELLVESSGNHAGDKGVFTDETTIRLRSGRSDSGRITSELRYEPKARDGNFTWELDVDNSVGLEMSGQLATTKNSIDLRLDDVTISAMRMDLLTLEGNYYLGPCKGMQVSLSGGTMLADMDEDDLEDLYYDIQDNAQDWAYDLVDMIPEDLLWYLF